jgi:hypothetical protein
LVRAAQCFGRLPSTGHAPSFVTHRHTSATGILRYDFHPNWSCRSRYRGRPHTAQPGGCGRSH